MMAFTAHAIHSGVMRGLDPRIHDDTQRAMSLRPSLRCSLMDCRVKPGNDNGEVKPGNDNGEVVRTRVTAAVGAT
jgi:hypothetical protein